MTEDRRVSIDIFMGVFVAKLCRINHFVRQQQRSVVLYVEHPPFNLVEVVAAFQIDRAGSM